MKIFRADEKLVENLMRQGFIETSTVEDKEWLERTFKLSEQAEKKIRFNGTDISLVNGMTIQETRTEGLTEQELKLYLLFFKLSEDDLKDLCPSTVFNINKVRENLTLFEGELYSGQIETSRKNKIERILKTFTDIKIN
jgi:hypothetical protein